MLTPERALEALASGEDVYTPEGDAVVIAHIEAMPTTPSARDYAYVAVVYGARHQGRRLMLDRLTARDGA